VDADAWRTERPSERRVEEQALERRARELRKQAKQLEEASTHGAKERAMTDQ